MTNTILKSTIVDSILLNIVNLIKDSNMKVGDRFMSERDYANKHGVSRTSVREAFKELSYSGIVESKQGSGTYINKLPSFLNDFECNNEKFNKMGEYNKLKLRLEARLILEPQVAELAARRITTLELKKLKEILESMKKHIDENNEAAYGMDDMNFHYTYVKASHNYILFKSMVEIWTSSVEYYNGFNQIPGLSKESYKQHVEIYNMFEKHNSNVKNAMREHVIYAMNKNLHNKMKYKTDEIPDYDILNSDLLLLL